MGKTLELSASYHPVHYLLGWVYKRKGDLSKALECFQKVAILDDSPVFQEALAHVYALNGDRTKALSILDELEEQSKRRYVSSYCKAVVYIGLDDMDQAFYWLDKTAEERSEMIPWLKIGAEYDSLRADPRFHDQLRRVGLHRNYDNQLKIRCFITQRFCQTALPVFSQPRARPCWSRLLVKPNHCLRCGLRSPATSNLCFLACKTSKEIIKAI